VIFLISVLISLIINAAFYGLALSISPHLTSEEAMGVGYLAGVIGIMVATAIVRTIF
jgi:uncharacterized membrane protein